MSKTDRHAASRLYAAEYQATTGQPVRTLWLDPFRQLIDVEYVAWLENELSRARGNAYGGKHDTITSQT